jgi:hypothetical protein
MVIITAPPSSVHHKPDTPAIELMLIKDMLYRSTFGGHRLTTGDASC